MKLIFLLIRATKVLIPDIVTKENDGNYYVALKTKDGRIILNSFKHLSKDACKTGIEIIRASAIDSFKYEYKKTYDGKFYFRLKSIRGKKCCRTMLIQNNGLKGLNQISLLDQ